MIELWSAQQHSWLSALGHEVLVQGALPEIQAAAVTASRTSPRPAPAPARSPRPAPAPRREEVSANGAQPHPRQAAARMPDRLHFALIRASGCNPNAPEAAQVIAQWPAAEQLRANPAAKRALWPRLRSLRKQALP